MTKLCYVFGHDIYEQNDHLPIYVRDDTWKTIIF